MRIPGRAQAAAASLAGPLGAAPPVPVDASATTFPNSLDTRNPALRRVFGIFPSLAYANYSYLWQGNVGTQIGYWMQQTVEGWLIYELTGSPLMLSVAAFCRSAPMLLVSPIGGVLADRVDRRKMLMATQLTAMVLALTIAALILTGLLEVWHLLAAAVIAGTVMAGNVPARQALVASIVPTHHLANAIAVHATSLGGARIVGPQIAGVLLAAVGAAFSYVIQACAYLWATFNLLRMRLSWPGSTLRGSGFVSNLAGGFKYALTKSDVRGLLLVGTLTSVFIYPYTSFLPAFAKDVLHVGAPGLGLLMGANGAGALVGSFATAAASGLRRKGWLLLGATLLFGGMVLLFSFSRSLVPSMLLLAAAGLGSGASQATSSAVMQLLVPDNYRGRMASLQIVVWGLIPVGALPLGAMATAWGTPAALALGGALSVVGILWVALFFPAVRRIKC